MKRRKQFQSPVIEKLSAQLKALSSSSAGNVLDLGCGSLAFTAKVYSQYTERPVVLVDQSLKMLRMAKSRIMKLLMSIFVQKVRE